MTRNSKTAGMLGLVFVTVIAMSFNACGRMKTPYTDTIDSAAETDPFPWEEISATDETEETTGEPSTTLVPTTSTTPTTAKPTTRVSTLSDGLGKKADSAELKLDNGDDKTLPIATVTTRTTATTGKTTATSPGGQTETTAPTAGADTFYLSVNPILQNPELPTGCEVTSLTIALNYLGYNVDKCTMVDQYLPWTTTWDSINTHFIGDPRSIHGCGCNAPVIVDTANRYFGDHGNRHTAVDKTGSSPSELYDLVKSGYPVMVWATIGMQDTYVSGTWTAQDTGETIVFMKREHCLVLTGYDKVGGTVTFCDPMVGVASYSMSLFETRYAQLGQQAVILKAK